MAGAGYKLFNTGDVLTAAQVNTYLQEQAVMRFASATARTTALSGVLAEGMVSYLDDTNSVEVYNGSAWVSVGSTGDITGVTAGTGISGGGTSGDVTITNSMATAIDAKGDLIAGTGADTFSRLAVGTNGYSLVADSSTSTGLAWQGFVGCSVYLSGGAQNTTAGVGYIVNYASEEYDTNNFHSTSTNTSRITIPTGYAGKYLVSTYMTVTTSDAAQITIYKNGNYAATGGETNIRVVNTAGNTIRLGCAQIVDCAVGDYLQTEVLIFTANKAINNAVFQAAYLGA